MFPVSQLDNVFLWCHAKFRLKSVIGANCSYEESVSIINPPALQMFICNLIESAWTAKNHV